MHEGKHGILDDVDDMDDIFGTNEEEEEGGKKDKHKHKHDHGDQDHHDNHQKSEKYTKNNFNVHLDNEPGYSGLLF